jgi:hypothetical protein
VHRLILCTNEVETIWETGKQTETTATLEP